MIKNILKRSGVTLSRLASDLNISRPTLDNYIEIYDKGEKISNIFYQDIFDFLFENANIDNTEFIKRYKYMVNHYGMSSVEPEVTVSKLKSSFNLPKGEYSEIIDQIQQIIENDKQSPNTPLEAYRLILNILKFKTNELQDVYTFFDLYKGNIKISSYTTEQKKLYGLLFDAMNKYENNSFVSSESLFDDFVAYSNKIYTTKHHQAEKIKVALVEKFTEVIEEELQKSDLSNLELDDIVELIKRKI